MTQYIDNRDGDYGLELPEPDIRQHSAEYRGEVAEQGERVVDYLEYREGG